MASGLDTLKGAIPSMNFSFSGMSNMIAIFLILLVIAIVVGILLYVFLIYRRFKYKVIVFEKVGGIWEPTRKDKGMEMAHGDGGDTVFFIRKHKKVLPRPTIQTGRNTFWYVIREDGEWINIGMGDIDMQMKKAGVQYTDKEMRFARTSLERTLKERYEKLDLWAKYGTVMISLGFIVVTGIMVFLALDKFMDVVSSLGGVAESVSTMIDAATAIVDQARELLIAIDNVRANTCPALNQVAAGV